MDRPNLNVVEGIFLNATLWTNKTSKHFGFGSIDAVVHGFGMCVGVPCGKSAVCHIF